jgi:predicted nucleic acid-binding protein
LEGQVICLDTNYLILGLAPGSDESRRLIAWARAGEALIAPAVVWYEFLCGPVTPSQIAVARAFLQEIIAIDERCANEAARLFNAAGRTRRLRVDALIAGTAIARNVPLATGNRADFQLFVAQGLRLISG